VRGRQQDFPAPGDNRPNRKAGRTNRTAAGAHRRSVIVGVLESLRANLERFDVAGVLAEVRG
jgi:hypothetical protein